MRKIVLLACAAGLASAASAQLPGLRRYTPADRRQQQQQPVLQGIDALRADFAAQAGGTTVYFGSESKILAPPAKMMLATQATWLRRHPEVVVRIEGYGDSGDTRDHARSSQTQPSLQISNFESQAMCREASRVSFLMCPFGVRVMSLD